MIINIRQLIFSLIGTQLPVFSSPGDGTQHRKSIAIVGAGSAGLVMLKTLLDFPEHSDSWDVVLFEDRENVGGIWLPEPHPRPPPVIPKTPLYPAVHTNTPAPKVTYPNFPFPPGTYLYPSHDHVQAYHVRYAHHYNLLPYIKLNHRVLNTSWIGTSSKGFWNVTFSNHKNETDYRAFEHLVVASGNFHIPRIPKWPGQKDWLAGPATPSQFIREIEHSAWFRRPEKYTNRSVLLVGYGPSGEDLAFQIAPLANRMYISIRSPKKTSGSPFPLNAIRKPAISHFTRESVVFVDDTEINVDSVLLATGYELRKPFLDAGNAIITDPDAHTNETYTKALVSNTRYIFPLHRHIFSLSPLHPTTALSFMGLREMDAPTRTADAAQAIFIAHSLRDPNIVPSRKEMLQELAVEEQKLRDAGSDPYVQGHDVIDKTGTQGCDYADGLVDYLVEKGVIENKGKKFVEEWRRKVYGYDYLQRGWKRIEASGHADEWVKDIETEEAWSDLMERVNEWERRYEQSRWSNVE